MRKIAYLGMGTMGRGMASNLIKAGHEVTVFDISPAAVKFLTDQGARAGSSPADLAAICDKCLAKRREDRYVSAAQLTAAAGFSRERVSITWRESVTSNRGRSSGSVSAPS